MCVPRIHLRGRTVNGDVAKLAESSVALYVCTSSLVWSSSGRCRFVFVVVAVCPRCDGLIAEKMREGRQGVMPRSLSGALTSRGCEAKACPLLSPLSALWFSHAQRDAYLNSHTSILSTKFYFFSPPLPVVDFFGPVSYHSFATSVSPWLLRRVSWVAPLFCTHAQACVQVCERECPRERNG